VSAKKGYVTVDAADGDVLCLDLSMHVRRVKADTRVRANRGKVALTYGPFIMCMEGVDNGADLHEVRLTEQAATVTLDEKLGLPTARLRKE
jgi:DUF1680 family protein